MGVLITGGAGYIGSHMALRLCDAGEQVVVYDNLSTGHKWLVPDRATFVDGDLADADALKACLQAHRITEIIHFAGSIVVPESVRDPLKYYFNNSCLTRSLLAAATEAGISHFLFSSTAAVYGVAERKPLSEDATTLPVSPYGASKLMCEWILRDVAHATGLRYGVLRYFNVAGADPLGRSGHSTATATHLIKMACKAALGQLDFLEIYGTDFDTPDGTGERDFIHVTDLVEAHVRMLDHLRASGSSLTLNCGYGAGYSVREVIAMVKEVSGKDFEVRECPRRSGDVASVIADGTRLRKLLNWTPQHATLREIVESSYGWERKLLL
jgi:UDP-glucose 4-epimerase